MKEFNKLIQSKFTQMSQSGKLFRVELTGQQIWDMYLGSFSKENDPVFRDPSSTVHNCNHCKNFFRRYGNIVSIDESFNIVTMFDVVPDVEFEATAKVMAAAIKASKIVEVFFETFNELNSLPCEACNKTNEVFQLGVASNPKRYTKEEAEKFGVVKPNEIRNFNHFHLKVDKAFVDMSGKSVEAIMEGYRSAKNVFQRAMQTISLDTLILVKDLINQGSLLDGTTHLFKVEQFILLKEEYDKILFENAADNWCWAKSYKLPLAKFKNELIGVLCSELSEGEELNKAVQNWNKRVDPINYMKVTAPITKKQIEEAKKFVEQNGYVESFNRRFANIDDIKVSEILHSNVGDGKIKEVSIFDGVKSTSTRHKRNEFDGVEEVSIDKFMKDILPTCSAIEAFLTNAQAGNLVSLTTAANNSKPIFKWSNNYSWTFNGNLAGKSQIKQAVKDAGGSVEGVLNFRLAWNDVDGRDDSDLDAWAQEPNRTLIGYSAGYRRDSGNHRTSMSGQLDVDNTRPNGKLAVENITWTDKSKMKDGEYMLWVNQYRASNSQGFKVEIEFDGETYCYEYKNPVMGRIQVAEVTLKNGKFTIRHILPESAVSSKEIYGLETNQFHKVSLVCLSPNHWGENNVGNKHYFFMLDGCKSPTSIRSFHNENLLPELAEHRKVLEVLGATNMIEPAEKQLSGLGFNSTVRDEVILRLQGSHKRVIKLKF
jgi:Icc-related predicted phosphoesterase